MHKVNPYVSYVGTVFTGHTNAAYVARLYSIVLIEILRLQFDIVSKRA